MGRKIICLGETVLDIIFRNSQPQQANPGGSTFNTSVSLGRAGSDVYLISETGDDEVGKIIRDFLKENNVDSSCVRVYQGMKSKVSLAILDEKNDARYTFYGDEPLERLDFLTPEICPDDVVVFGSYYALNPANREFVKKFLSYARSCGAIIYYDINFRPSHASDLDQLRPFIMDNIASSDIVRASVDDIHTAFGLSDPRLVYDTVISRYCSVFICTDASREILLADYGSFYEYPVQKIETVSTIGAGDSFNAGIAYGLIHEDVVKDDLRDAPWEQLIEWGQLFSRNCCMSIENYIDKDLLQA